MGPVLVTVGMLAVVTGRSRAAVPFNRAVGRAAPSDGRKMPYARVPRGDRVRAFPREIWRGTWGRSFTFCLGFLVANRVMAALCPRVPGIRSGYSASTQAALCLLALTFRRAPRRKGTQESMLEFKVKGKDR